MAKEISPEEEFQIYQQQLQTLLIQKESLKLKISEIESALEELEKSEQKQAYKIVGNVMVSKNVEELKKELMEKKEEAELRIKSLEKTEERVMNKLKDLQTLVKGEEDEGA
ncbi:MAG: prefoldin subunit [Candidatus Aenigmatarchaeota archaeon]